jgi:hypothetical protein
MAGNPVLTDEKPPSVDSSQADWLSDRIGRSFPFQNYLRMDLTLSPKSASNSAD